MPAFTKRTEVRTARQFHGQCRGIFWHRPAPPVDVLTLILGIKLLRTIVGKVSRVLVTVVAADRHRRVRHEVAAGRILWFGRAPEEVASDAAPDDEILSLPHAGDNVSRLLGRVVVGREAARLYWLGHPGGRLVSLHEAPAGPREVALNESVAPFLDMGDNELFVVHGRKDHRDLKLSFAVVPDKEVVRDLHPARPPGRAPATTPLPGLEAGSTDWYVALALAEPRLALVPYAKAPTNREIAKRVREWRGETSPLTEREVTAAKKRLAKLAFRGSDLADLARCERWNNEGPLSARILEADLVTVEQLTAVLYEARKRQLGENRE